MFNLMDIIDLAVRIEKNGEKTYRKAMEKVSDPLLLSILDRLAREESEHEKWFEALKGKVEAAEIDPELEEMGKGMLQGVLGDQAFSISESDFSKIENIKALLELSIEFEMDTILFYGMIGTFVEDEETINSLKAIIEEENRHVHLLTESLEKGVFSHIGEKSAKDQTA
jgi:rubrerythrin